ncbi:MAG: TraR/DksA C4-type zinc finger protein [Candidatus Paceibacterota bacterium]|nr:MAG: TraR/DksA C4-type zinc finger protein [Candidatus Paceibacterota bacterium]
MQKRNDLDLEHLRQKLEEEKKILIEELESVGRINPDNKEDWEARPAEIIVSSADANEVGDAYEAYRENASILNELEIRFNNVKNALKKIEDGSYGFCKISGEPIERDRLEANPAAETCKEHMNN